MLPLVDVTSSNRSIQALLAQETALLEAQLRGSGQERALLLDGTPLPPPRAGWRWFEQRCVSRPANAGANGTTVDVRREATACMDVILLRHALEYAVDPEALLAQALRVLAPGGRLLLAGFHGWSPWRAMLAQQARRAGEPWRIMPPRRLQQRLTAAGVRIESVARFGPVWPGPAVSLGAGGVLAPAYLLTARKQRANLSLIATESSPNRRNRVLPTLAGAAQRLRA